MIVARHPAAADCLEFAKKLIRPVGNGVIRLPLKYVSSNRRAIAIALGRKRRNLGLRTCTGRIRLGLWNHTVPSGTGSFLDTSRPRKLSRLATIIQSLRDNKPSLLSTLSIPHQPHRTSSRTRTTTTTRTRTKLRTSTSLSDHIKLF